MNQKDLAKLLGISQGYLSKGLSWARNNIPKPRNIPKKELSAGLGISTTTNEPSNNITRIHAFGRKYPLSSYPSPLAIEQALNKANYVYGSTYSHSDRGYSCSINSLEACLSSNSLTVWHEEIDVPSGTVELRNAYDDIERGIEATAWLSKTMLVLDIDLARFEQVIGHTAFMGDEGAILANQQHQRLLIKDDKDGKARFYVDVSKGRAESEFVHRNHFKQDSLLYAKHVELLTKGVWGIEQQLAFNQQLLEHQTLQNQFFTTHNELMAEIRDDLKLFREQLQSASQPKPAPQKRLRLKRAKGEEDIRQRRLV